MTIYEQCGATLLHRPTPPPRTVTPGLMQQLFPAIQRSHEGLIDRPIVGGVHPRRPKTREPCALSLHAIPGRERFRIAPPFPVGIPSAVSPKSEARPPAGGRQAPAELLQPHLRILGRTGRHTLFAGSRVQLGVRSPDAVRWGPFQVVARTAWPARCACEVACPFTGAPRGGSIDDHRLRAGARTTLPRRLPHGLMSHWSMTSGVEIAGAGPARARFTTPVGWTTGGPRCRCYSAVSSSPGNRQRVYDTSTGISPTHGHGLEADVIL